MKKILSISLYGLLFMISAFIGSICARAASKTATGFWASDSVQGVAYTSTIYLSAVGYECTVKRDQPPLYFYSALSTDDIVFVSCHGAAGAFDIAPGLRITGNSIATRNFTAVSRLVYISACHTGLQSSTNGNVLSALVSKGVTSAVGFTDELSAMTDTDGSHRFDMLFAYRFAYGVSLKDSLSFAKNTIFHDTGKYWGSDSYVIYGNPNLKIK